MAIAHEEHRDRKECRLSGNTMGEVFAIGWEALLGREGRGIVLWDCQHSIRITMTMVLGVGMMMIGKCEDEEYL